MNLRPLGYEHPNCHLTPLPSPPPSLHVFGRAGRGVSSSVTRVEMCRCVLVTGLVTGTDGRASRPLPPPTVLLVHARDYTSRWSPFANPAESAFSVRSRKCPFRLHSQQLPRSTALGSTDSTCERTTSARNSALSVRGRGQQRARHVESAIGSASPGCASVGDRRPAASICSARADRWPDAQRAGGSSSLIRLFA